jgi:2-polyprenyl-3-methyl-5-hydroxy-6-metoxy-1,4-benzoquinol methylase
MKVSALDISRLYQRYIPAITEYVLFIREDVLSHEGTYDIVIASHVIEHLTDPVPFCRRLQEMARLAVFIVTPFNEPADNLTKGHAHYLESVDPDDTPGRVRAADQQLRPRFPAPAGGGSGGHGLLSHSAAHRA